jgi:hypothetical protein
VLVGAKIGYAFSVQNGVLKNDLLRAAFGHDHVLGALANMSGELRPSGEVLFTRNVSLQIGSLAGGIPDAVLALARTIDASGVRAAAVPDVAAREWSKFVAWVGMLGLSITTRVVTWKYLLTPTPRSCSSVDPRNAGLRRGQVWRSRMTGVPGGRPRQRHGGKIRCACRTTWRARTGTLPDDGCPRTRTSTTGRSKSKRRSATRPGARSTGLRCRCSCGLPDSCGDRPDVARRDLPGAASPWTA